MLTALGIVSFALTIIIFFCLAGSDYGNKESLITIIIGFIITGCFLSASWYITPVVHYKNRYIRNCLLYTEACVSRPLLPDKCEVESIKNICKETIFSGNE